MRGPSAKQTRHEASEAPNAHRVKLARYQA